MNIFRCCAIALACMLGTVASSAATLDPHLVEFQTPQDIHWVHNSAGTSGQAVLFGDPSEPGSWDVRMIV